MNKYIINTSLIFGILAIPTLGHASTECPDWGDAKPDTVKIGDTAGIPSGYKVIDTGTDCQKGDGSYSGASITGAQKFKEGNECLYRFGNPASGGVCHVRLGEDDS